jgi:Kef-type K+ transport system membrane component KefB
MSIFQPGTDSELRNELKDLNKTIKESNIKTEKFTTILIVVALLQLIIAIFQLLIPFFIDPKYAWIGLVVELLLVATVLLVFKSFGFKISFKDKTKIQKNKFMADNLDL